MVVVKLHTSYVGISSGADPERSHTAAVDIERADWEEVEEEPIIRLLRICNVLGEVVLVVYSIERRWVIYGEGWMCVLAMQTLLVSIDPVKNQLWSKCQVLRCLHGLPVESAFVANASPMW